MSNKICKSEELHVVMKVLKWNLKWHEKMKKGKKGNYKQSNRKEEKYGIWVLYAKEFGQKKTRWHKRRGKKYR